MLVLYFCWQRNSLNDFHDMMASRLIRKPLWLNNGPNTYGNSNDFFMFLSSSYVAFIVMLLNIEIYSQDENSNL